jgi:hypothetical protein
VEFLAEELYCEMAAASFNSPFLRDTFTARQDAEHGRIINWVKATLVA